MYLFQVYALAAGELVMRAVLATDRKTAIGIAVERVKAQFGTGAKVTRIVPVLDVSDFRKLAIRDTGLIQSLELIDQIGFVSLCLYHQVAELIERNRELIQTIRDLQIAESARGDDP